MVTVTSLQLSSYSALIVFAIGITELSLSAKHTVCAAGAAGQEAVLFNVGATLSLM